MIIRIQRAVNSAQIWKLPRSIERKLAASPGKNQHEWWRDDNDTDNVPMVRKRDGTMGAIDKNRGFINYHRIPEPYRDPLERVFDWKEINYGVAQHDDVEQTVQAARCMDCGTPFCQTHTGCPVNNLIPEWNELVYKVILIRVNYDQLLIV